MEISNDLFENKPVRDIAYETLKHQIITGELEPGARIVETSYANQMHISRTPLREALRKLERDGLVEYQLRKGVVVRAFTFQDIDEIFMIRNSMMILLLPSIVENATAEDIQKLQGILSDMDVEMARENQDCQAIAHYNRLFHSTFEHISDKKRILNVIDSQEEYVIRFSAITIQSIIRRSKAHEEHHKIVELLKQKDVEGLKTLVAHHFEESRNTCLNTIQQNGFKKRKDDAY